MKQDEHKTRIFRDPLKVRYYLWNEAFLCAELALATAIRFQKRHERAWKKYAQVNDESPKLAYPELEVFTKGKIDTKNFNLGGLTSEECRIIQSALFDKAVVEIMTVFGQMGEDGIGVAANNEDEVNITRDVLVQDIARVLELPEADILSEIKMAKTLRNEWIAHRSGSDIKDALLFEIIGPGGTGQGVRYSSVKRLISYDRLHDICKVACELTHDLVFPEDKNS